MGPRGSFSAYAEHIGASPAYVSKLKAQGRLVIVKNKDTGKDEVDFALSDRLVRNTADLARAGNGANAKPAGAPIPPPLPDNGGPMGNAARFDTVFRQAQTKEKIFTAHSAELDFKKKLGDLVERKRVEDAAYACGRMMRDAVLGVPTRLAPELADVGDAWEIERRLTEALRKVLDDVSTLAAADLARAVDV